MCTAIMLHKYIKCIKTKRDKHKEKMNSPDLNVTKFDLNHTLLLFIIVSPCFGNQVAY